MWAVLKVIIEVAKRLSMKRFRLSQEYSLDFIYSWSQRGREETQERKRKTFELEPEQNSKKEV